MMMKLSVAIADEFADQSAFVVWRGFEESIRKAKACGYHGVELALKSRDDVKGINLDRLLSQHDMEVSCISTGQVFSARGLFFTNPDASAQKSITEIFIGLIDLAKNYGCAVNIGRARGYVAHGRSLEQTKSQFASAFIPVCAYAEKQSVTLIIEPVNRYEINFINTIDQGADLIRTIPFKNIGLMPDVFHMNIEEAGMADSLIKHAPDIRYIHFADSNRHYPGGGHLDFHEVFRALQSMDYQGWGSVEILPLPTPDIAAEKAASYLLPLMAKYGSKQ